MNNRSHGNNPVIMFDGECNFCSGWVKFVMKRDPSCIFRFVSLQSEAGRKLRERSGIDTENIDSAILIEDGKAFLMSSAVLRICRRLTGGYKLGYGLLLIPKPIRDSIYKIVAAHRYRWFGRSESCIIPSPEMRQRFLEWEEIS